MAITDTSDLAPKTRIVATMNLPGVPEGTAGRLGRSVGLTLTRYRVAFDNDVDLVSVTHTHLVKEDEWDEFQEQRDADAAAEEKIPTAAEVGPKADDAAANAPADDRVAALLAKSAAAKAAKAGGEPPSEQGSTPEPATEPEAASSPADDRLAALLAKSAAAKAKKQAEG